MKASAHAGERWHRAGGHGQRGVTACTGPATGRRGSILSAGPNGNLDTGPNATQLAVDDIGYIFVTSQ